MKMLPVVFQTLLFQILASISVAVPVFAAEPAPPVEAARDQLIILVRHAEKASDQGNDPALTQAGTARADALKTALGDAGVGAIITTEWQRTRLTGAPLAQALGIESVTVGTAQGESAQHPQKVADTVRAQSAGVVLVVGHSNTVPAIILALGGPDVGKIGDDDYGNLYLLWRHAGKVRLVKSRY
jgi:phosphohistidine phosphatase SixA